MVIRLDDIDLGKSPNTKRILEYFTKKYGKSMRVVGLVKALSVASLKVKNCFPLNVINVSPSGQFKSRTSIEQLAIFGKRHIINFGSDFTIHGLALEYDKGKGITGKTCLINDLTLLFGSKSKQAKERLINALAELLSEGVYNYKNFKENWQLKASITMIGNVTIDAYMKYYKELLESTFGERCLTVYNIMDREETHSFNKEKEKRIKIEFGDRVNLKSFMVDYNHYIDYLSELAMKWQVLCLSPSLSRVFDRIISLVCANALLNGRKKICEDDIRVLGLIQPSLVNPLSHHATIVELYTRNLTQAEICREMGKEPRNYQGYVSKVLSDYRKKGVLKFRDDMDDEYV